MQVTNKAAKPASVSLNLTACVCVSVILLSACSNPLQRQAAVETNLSPTRTPVPAKTSEAISQPTPADQKAATKSSVTAVDNTPTLTATAKPLATQFDLCSATKPGLKATAPVLGNTPGQIVYLTTDNNIVLTDESGRTRVNVTTDAFVSADGNAGRIYMFPTFSNDGKSLAFISMATTADFNGITQTVHVALAASGATLTNIYETNEFNIPYLDFSPDSEQVAFLTISGSFGAIRVVNKKGGDITVFDTGSPSYWHWRQDSSAMVTHLGGRATERGATASIALIEAKGATKVKRVVLDALPGNFQSPHYSPDGTHVLYVANTSKGSDQDELILADAVGKPICTLTSIKASAFFAWSPDGSHVAVMDTSSPLNQPAAVQIYDLSDGSTKSIKEDASVFFWSPSGDKLAVYSIVTNPQFDKLGAGTSKMDSLAQSSGIAQTQFGLRLEVIDIASGKATRIADTYPSRQLQQYFQYFDQYSRSLSPWSPDGKHLVFATLSPTAQTVDVAVAAIDAVANSVSVKRVAAGTIAFWSPK